MSRISDNEFGDRCHAHHEAGHAVAAVVHGFEVLSLDILPISVPGVGQTYGSANLDLPASMAILGKGENAVMPILIVLFAGYFAEQRINANAELDTGPHQSDGNRLVEYAQRAICSPFVKDGTCFILPEELKKNEHLITACLEKAHGITQEFVSIHALAIDAVAEALADAKILRPADVKRIIRDAIAE